MKKSTWNTYMTLGYTYDVAQDQRSAGGVHHHQIRKTSEGWQTRIEQSNGAHFAVGPVRIVSDEEGEAAYILAKSY